MSITILGDFYLGSTEDVDRYYKLEQSILKKAFATDFVVVNLEGSLPVGSSAKVGPKLALDRRVFDLLRYLGVDAVNLANNHANDHGASGLRATVLEAERCGLEVFGVFCDELSNRAHLTIGDFRIISMADTEFGVSSWSKCTPAPFSFEYLVSAISEAKAEGKAPVVVLHDGLEYSEIPTPELRSICRAITGLGVAAVICQHSHVIGVYEVHNESFIFYGSGNCIFEYAGRDHPSWKRGLAITVEEGSPPRGATYSTADLEVCRADYFEDYSLIARFDDQSYEKYWAEEFAKRENSYASLLNTMFFNRLFHAFDRRVGLSRLLVSHNKGFAIKTNIIRSRVHREVISFLWGGRK